MSTEVAVLRSEITELESILKEIPAHAVIERMTFERRLAVAREALDHLPPVSHREKLKLVFRGKPVDGSHGIVANFGARAASAFSDAFSAVSAGLSEDLKYMGPIPKRNGGSLLITGTAIGSFGFEFELPSGSLGNDQEEPTPAEEAARNIQRLFRVAADGSDEEVAEVVDVIHPRAVRKVYAFLGFLVKNEAWCGLEFEGSYFRYKNVAQLRASADRLVEANIKQSEVMLFGQLKGVLPQSRSFEFQTDADDLIKGRVGPEIENAEELNLRWLNTHTAARFDVIQVGKARPRYTLTEIIQDR